VAGTQFTAYMALMNLAIAYAATWQGVAIEALGYPVTLLIDALTGLFSLPCCPGSARRAPARRGADAPARRARGSAWVLALLCLAWLPFARWGDALGAARGVLDLFFTLAFVTAAGGAALCARGLTRAAPWWRWRAGAMQGALPSPGWRWPHQRRALAGAACLAGLARLPWAELGSASVATSTGDGVTIGDGVPVGAVRPLG
jgi:PAT family beta-lactamase induction signal transducer AmpG